MKKPLYFDNAATTPLDPEVDKVMRASQISGFGNSQNSHYYGWESADLIEQARTHVRAALGAGHSKEITFTSGATESNNWIFHHLLNQILTGRYSDRPEVLVSAGEHASVMESAKYLQHLNLIDLKVAPLNSIGQAEPQSISELISDKTVLVSIMWVQNEIGAINQIDEICKMCYQKGIPFHTDATQALGRVPLNIKKLPITFLSASAHKVYGPKGIGLLFCNQNLSSEITPFFRGGGHENGRRSGTLATPLIAGFGESCRLVADPGLTRIENERIAKLRHQLCLGLLRIFPDLKINTSFDHSVSTHLHVSWREFLLPKALAKIAASRGSACSSQRANWLSPTLTAIGLSSHESQNSIRLTLGRFTLETEIEEALINFEDLKYKVQSARNLER